VDLAKSTGKIAQFVEPDLSAAEPATAIARPAPAAAREPPPAKPAKRFAPPEAGLDSARAIARSPEPAACQVRR
jgi:hypothetical protein